MNTEQLRIIVDLLNSLGAGSKDAFITWLIVNYASVYLFGIIWSVIAAYIGKKLFGVWTVYLTGERLRKAANVSVMWNDRELRRAEDVLRKHYASFKD